MVISTRPCRRLVVVVAAEILLVRHRTLRILLRVLPRSIAERKAVLLLATTLVRVLLHFGIRPLLLGEILCRLHLTHHLHMLGQVNYPPSLRDNLTGPRLTPGPVVGGNGDGGGGGGGGNGGGPGESIQDIYGPKKLKTWKDVVALNIDEGSAYKTRALEKFLFEDLPDTCVGNRAWDISAGTAIVSLDTSPDDQLLNGFVPLSSGPLIQKKATDGSTTIVKV